MDNLKMPHIVLWPKEVLEQVRHKVSGIYLSRTRYKAITKTLKFKCPTVRAIIHKWRNFETVFLSKKALMPHRGHHKSLGNPWESSEDDQEEHKSSPRLFPRCFWKIFCGLMRQRWNVLESACPVIPRVKTALYYKKNVYISCQSIEPWLLLSTGKKNQVVTWGPFTTHQQVSDWLKKKQQRVLVQDHT